MIDSLRCQVWIHYSVYSEATLPQGCSQPSSEHSGGARAGSFLSQGGFLKRAILAWGFSIRITKSSSELCCGLKLFLLNPSFLFPFKDLRPVSWAEGYPWLLLLLPTLSLILHRHCLQFTSCTSNSIWHLLLGEARHNTFQSVYACPTVLVSVLQRNRTNKRYIFIIRNWLM